MCVLSFVARNGHFQVVLLKVVPLEEGGKDVLQPAPPPPRVGFLACPVPTERETSLLTTYWSGSTDVFGVPASRHGSLNPLFQIALYLPSRYQHPKPETDIEQRGNNLKGFSGFCLKAKAGIWPWLCFPA